MTVTAAVNATFAGIIWAGSGEPESKVTRAEEVETRLAVVVYKQSIIPVPAGVLEDTEDTDRQTVLSLVE